MNFGLLEQSRVINDELEQSMEWELARETEVLGENLSRFNTVDHKSHMTWHGIEPGYPWWKAGS
jgi:hypothetical protein